jgi:2-amino-4-hydroxy-6-hydroxymethyldihydropteridine diphosphokinase
VSPAPSTAGLVAIGLGANLGSPRLGPPAATLAWAGERLATLLPGLRLAPLYRTAPISHLAQPDFLNTVALANEPALSPRQLLAELKAIEREAGREAPAERDAPRALDLDLLFFGDSELNEPGLTLPHPRLRGRLFVLAPLRDLAPGLALPPDGKTVAELYAAIAGTQQIARA